MFSVVSVYQSVILSTREGGPHVTIVHDAMDLIIKDPQHLPLYTGPTNPSYITTLVVTSGGQTGGLFKFVCLGTQPGADTW